MNSTLTEVMHEYQSATLQTMTVSAKAVIPTRPYANVTEEITLTFDTSAMLAEDMSKFHEAVVGALHYQLRQQIEPLARKQATIAANAISALPLSPRDNEDVSQIAHAIHLFEVFGGKVNES